MNAMRRGLLAVGAFLGFCAKPDQAKAVPVEVMPAQPPPVPMKRAFGSLLPALAVLGILAISIMGADAALITYASETGDITFDIVPFVVKIINTVAGLVAAAIPLWILGVGLAYVFRVFGWFGARRK